VDFSHQILLEIWKFWLVVGIVFLLAEGVTPGTFALFFGGVGALATAWGCYLFPALARRGTWQLLAFAAASLLSLFLLRPLILRLLRSDVKLDGPDAFLGKQARVLSTLRKSGLETGRVLFEGAEWSAAPGEGCADEIPAGSVVEVIKVEGLTLRVRPMR
jgi:membrane protein implicated in regulation of membrane protease activity